MKKQPLNTRNTRKADSESRVGVGRTVAAVSDRRTLIPWRISAVRDRRYSVRYGLRTVLDILSVS
ncbi:MAG: hypothetical protein WC429_12940, partial [Verrucomicrobiia bacterium]